MIVTAEGHAKREAVSSAGASMIVCATGIAHTKRGKVAAVIRFIKRSVYQVKQIFAYVTNEGKRVFMATKSGKPTSIDPPAHSTT